MEVSRCWDVPFVSRSAYALRGWGDRLPYMKHSEKKTPVNKTGSSSKTPVNKTGMVFTGPGLSEGTVRMTCRIWTHRATQGDGESAQAHQVSTEN